MGIHHLALVVKDIEATHRFYTEAMGFELAKVEVVPKGGGVARHVFYQTGPARDQLIAFWDLSRVPGTGELKTDISTDLGFERGTNHLAFTADDLEDLKRKRERWLALGREDAEEALALLRADAPERSAPPKQMSMHKAKRAGRG